MGKQKRITRGIEQFLPDTKQLPKNAVAKTALYILGVMGFGSMVLPGVNAGNGLTIDTSLNNIKMTVEQLIVSNGRDTRVEMNSTGGIRLPQAPSTNGVLKLNTNKYVSPAIIVSDDIEDGAITTVKIADGTITSDDIANNAVTSAKILDGTVSSSDIATNAVTTAHITDGAVNTADLANNAVTTIKIEDGAVTNGKLADNSVTTSKIVDGNVTTPKLADGAVTTPKIADSNVTTIKIADNNVNTADLANNAVTTIKIADGNVTTPKLADGAVTTPKLADNSVTSPKIVDGQVLTQDLGNGAVTTIKLADNSVTSPKIVDGQVLTQDLGNGAVTTPKIADGAVTTPKITDNAVTTPKIADNAVTTPKIADGTILCRDLDASLAGILCPYTPRTPTVGSCPAGQYLKGVSVTGGPICEAPIIDNLPTCSGSLPVGYKWGMIWDSSSNQWTCKTEPISVTESLWTETSVGDIYNKNYAAGNVGIGTTSPSSKLTVQGSLTVRGSGTPVSANSSSTTISYALCRSNTDCMAGDTCEGYSTAPAPAGESSTTYNGRLETQFGCYPRTSNTSNLDRPTLTRTAGTYKEAWPITNSDQQTHAIVNCTLVAPTNSNGVWKATRSFGNSCITYKNGAPLPYEEMCNNNTPTSFGVLWLPDSITLADPVVTNPTIQSYMGDYLSTIGGLAGMYLSPSETIPQPTPACNPTYNTSSINLATNNTFISTYTPAARCHYAPNWTSSPDIKVFSPGGTVTPGGGTVETLGSCKKVIPAGTTATPSSSTILTVANGKVGILTNAPSYALDVVGAIRASSYNSNSDIRLKTNISPIEDALESLMQINGYHYTLLSDGSEQYGVIAQEIEKMFPQLVLTDSEGMKSVNYNGLIAPIIESIKTLNSKLETLQTQLDDNTSRIDALEQLRK